MILHFREVMHMAGPAGEFVDERRCIEFPRLSILQQRQQFGCETVTTFLVAGIAGDFAHLDDALDVLRATPVAGEIVAVPPRPPHEEHP
jgi:hypothetical protein